MNGSSATFGGLCADNGVVEVVDEERVKFSGAVTSTSGMLGRWVRSFREVDAKRRGFLAGGAGKGASLMAITSYSGRLWARIVSFVVDGGGRGVLSVLALFSSFSDDTLCSATRLKSNVRGVGTSTIGEGIESLTPAAPIRVGKS